MAFKNLIIFVGIVFFALIFSGITESSSSEAEGTKWAVLVAGSNGYWNYRHQVRTFLSI